MDMKDALDSCGEGNVTGASPPTASGNNTYEPLLLRLTSRGAKLLDDAAACEDLGPLAKEAGEWLGREAAPWRLLAQLCAALREQGGGASHAAWLHEVTAGGGLSFPPPAAPRLRDPVLEQRCERLRHQANERAYQSLVADVTARERDEEQRTPVGPVMRDVGFGVHVLTAMFTGFMAGYFLGHSFGRDAGVKYGCGVAGLVVAMLVESWLFIIQTGFGPEGIAAKRALRLGGRQRKDKERPPTVLQAGVPAVPNQVVDK